MLETFLFTLLIIVIGLGFLCIRIWVGKRFVHTHVDGNKALNEKGIHCVQSLDAAKRQDNPHAVSEK